MLNYKKSFKKNLPVSGAYLTIAVYISLFFACGPKMTPAQIQVKYQKADSLAAAGNYKKALKEYKKALKSDEKNPATYRKIAECYTNLDLPDSAVTYYEGAIVFNPRDIDAYQKVGDNYFNRQMYHEAMTWYDRGIQLGYLSPNSYIKLAKIHHNWNELDMAGKYYEMAVMFDSTNADGYYGLGLISLEAADTASAETDFLKAFDNGPHSLAAYHLGEIYAQRKQYDEAIKWLGRCEQLEPESELGRQAYHRQMEIIVKMKSGQE
jgi:tetratricopeptide (TPR) repeat protein